MMYYAIATETGITVTESHDAGGAWDNFLWARNVTPLFGPESVRKATDDDIAWARHV